MRPRSIEKLHHRLRGSLPGAQAHRAMLPAGRVLRPPGWSSYRPAAVLVPLFQQRGLLTTLLILRPSSMSRHGGEVAFPGGLLETGEVNPTVAALREAEEEVGLSPDEVEVLGRLSDIYIPLSRLRLSPVVGWIASPPLLRPNRREVERLLRVPIEALRRPSSVRRWRPPSWSTPVNCFEIDGLCVWGATAMILNELLAVM